MTDKIESWKRRKAEDYVENIYPEDDADTRGIGYLAFLAGLAEGERLGLLRGRAELLREIEGKMTPRVSFGKGFFMGFAESEEKKLSALLAEGAGEEK